jgi:amino acid adenylation domain-containing protein
MIHELFEAQVERTPDAVAVVFEGSRLTYRELDRRADELAHRLRRLGVAPNVLVALFLNRSIDMLVGMLGVLKAGGAYIPLDPTHPRNRIAWVLEDAQPLVLLAHSQLKSSLPPHCARVVTLDGNIPAEFGSEPDPVAPRTSHLSNLAYVIYTSGSTGKPKGVEIEHGAVINFLTSMQRRPGLDVEDTVLAITTLAFDIAVLEIFLPLACGASVVIASAEATHDGTALAELITRCGITVMQATPSTLRMLLDAGWTGASRLKILCGGEAWTAELAEPLLTRCSSLWNMYGPTETTVWSAVAKVETGQPIVIGTPVANTRLYVLDRALQLLPVGVPGELYIGGKGLARGYLGQPELTRERFVRDPYASGSGALMFRTGDSVRRLADGTLEFIGRLDNQVKIRGHRVELGEIEAVLVRHPDVTQCAIVASDDSGGERRLVAYFVPASGSAVAVGDLRLLLSEAVPNYMIPSAFVSLSSLPLTPNGKLDRKALPSPDQTAFDVDEASVTPSNPDEEEMARIWCEILDVARVGIRDNFFDLGGNSLLAVRVVGRMNQKLGTKLGVGTIFHQPTIEGMSTLVKESRQVEKQSPQVISLQNGGDGLPLYFIGSGPVEHRIARLMGDHTIFGIDVPVLAEWYSVAKSSDRAALPTIEQLGELYANVLRSHAGSSPCVIAGYSFWGKVAFEVARALQRANVNVAFVLLIDAYAWSGFTRETTLRVLRSIRRGTTDNKDTSYIGKLGASLHNSMRLLLWLCAQTPRVVIGALREKRLPDGMIDNEGRQIEPSAVYSLHRILGESYDPRPIDASGVLIRARLPYERMLPQADLTNGWRPLFARGLEVVQTIGDHWSIVGQDHETAALALQIDSVLNQYDLRNKKPTIKIPSTVVEPPHRERIS